MEPPGAERPVCYKVKQLNVTFYARENVIESQQSHVEELEEALERLREELDKSKAEYEERLSQVQQQHTSSLK